MLALKNLRTIGRRPIVQLHAVDPIGRRLISISANKLQNVESKVVPVSEFHLILFSDENGGNNS